MQMVEVPTIDTIAILLAGVAMLALFVAGGILAKRIGGNIYGYSFAWFCTIVTYGLYLNTLSLFVGDIVMSFYSVVFMMVNLFCLVSIDNAKEAGMMRR